MPLACRRIDSSPHSRRRHRTASAPALAIAIASAALVPAFLLGGARAAHAQEGAHAAAAARVLESREFLAAVATLDREHERIVEDGIRLTEIPAPPFKEEARAKAFELIFQELGLADVKIDEVGNVLAVRKGKHGDGKFLVVSAHLDTVFPEGTDVKVKRQGTKLFAPGIGDDTMSLSVLAGWIRAMKEGGISTRDDILFVGTVGEEGRGDLRGVRHLFTKGEYKDRIKAFFSVEAGSVADLTNGGVGSRRYRVTFNGPGGHSFGAFGLVNPMYALALAASEFSRIHVPASPKTTYSIGVIGGGTSVNSIPLSGFMDIDMRSEAPEALNRVEARMLEIIKQAAESENFARSTKEGKITVEPKLIGDRPAGSTDAKSDFVQLATHMVEAGGYKVRYRWSSTDSNLPMSLGIPSLTIGRMAPDKGGRSHSLDEWIDIDKAPMVKAMATGLSIVLGAAGME